MNLQPGSQLQGGRYTVGKVLGQGGFGITYLGEQTGLGRKVAIKEFFIKEHCDRAEGNSYVSVGTVGSRGLVENFREKFVKEARNIAKLKHVNIVSIIDIFEENNTAYYVMDYLEGGSLSDLITRNGALDEALSVKLISQVASALDHLHSKKMMHLDVKPANILIDDEGNAVLIDFGLSKQYDSEGMQTSTSLTGLSHGYSPLEQYRDGGAGTFSPATDIYSLGATLYKMLSGKTPPEAVDLINSDLPALPSNVSASVRNAVEVSMRSRRKDRPQNIGEFLALLNGNSAGAAIGAANAMPISGNNPVFVPAAGDKTEVLTASSDKTEVLTASSDKTEVLTASGDKTEVLTASSDKTEILSAASDKTEILSATSDKTEILNHSAAMATAGEAGVKATKASAPVGATANNASPKEPKKSGSSKWLIILLLLLLFAVGGAAAYFFLLSKGTFAAEDNDRTVRRERTETRTDDNQSVENEENDATVGNDTIATEQPEAVEEQQITNNVAPVTPVTPTPQQNVQPTPQPARPVTPSNPTETTVSRPTPANSYESNYNAGISTSQSVDLGLPSGLIWAGYNVGASTPSGTGNYYSWGEIMTKNDYVAESYQYNNEDIGVSITGTEYDVARQQWGGSWRIPTKEEFDELVYRCKFEWTTYNGVNGYRIVGPNGKSIFFPAAGYYSGPGTLEAGDVVRCWSATRHRDRGSCAYYLKISNRFAVFYGSREFGMPIRPVRR